MKGQTNWRQWASLAAFLAFSALVVAYYVWHKPFSPALALSLARSFGQSMVCIALLSVAGGLGTRLLSRPNENPLAVLAIQAALGMGCLSLGVLLVGVLGGLQPVIAWAVLIILAVLLRRQILGWWRLWRGLGDLFREGGWFGWAVALGLALIFVVTLTAALAPPLKFDALVYHLTLPHIYQASGRLVYVPQIMFWGMPQNGEMLYTWAMLLGGPPAAAVLGWTFGLVAALGLAGYVHQRMGAPAAWVSLAALLAAFTQAAALAWGYVDWLVILFGLAFLVALDGWSVTGERNELLLAGIFAGLALGTKYTAGVLLVCGIVAIVWYGRRRVRMGEWVRQIILFGSFAVLVACPWFIKNALTTGNPFYPFFFPSGAMDRLRLDLYQGGLPWGSWLDVFLLPVRATLLGVEGSPGYSASIGPLLFGLGLAAWLGWHALTPEQRRTATLATLLLCSGLLVWMAAGRFSSYLLQSRLYFAIFPSLAVLAGAGFAALSQSALPGVRLGRIASVLVLLVLGLHLFELGAHALNQGASRYLLALRTSEAYLADNLGWYSPAMKELRELPVGSRALMLWETRSFYCWPVCEPDETIDRWLRERYGDGSASPRTPEEILRAWKQAGYTHLLYYRLGADFIRSQSLDYQPADWQALDDLLARLSPVKDFGDAYTLYRLSP